MDLMRKHTLDLIWRGTHTDFRTITNGRRYVMAMGRDGSTLYPLDELPIEIEAMLFAQASGHAARKAAYKKESSTMPKRNPARYAVEAGRLITRDGKPFVAISREGDTRPVEADEAAHLIARLLNQKGK